ncbi:hypothetical protein HFO61_12725 [Rhizobium leguminosarum]|uniref:hypothetical protein n=1 Tax=Rhizobium leguminosarum TaxID=384 RepID=UPI001C90DBD6|nr:hypothetical protein [Rhizobium leguminosarum]MBY3177120.1 hypothetical protein [Rhizobium leguminosarum]MBY5547666.1 hypothetical protein [Rhizobium leguminosarum]
MPTMSRRISASPSVSVEPSEGISINVDKHVIPSNFIAVIHRLNLIGQNAGDSRKVSGAIPAKARSGFRKGLLLSISRGLTRQASSDYLNGRRLSGA